MKNPKVMTGLAVVLVLVGLALGAFAYTSFSSSSEQKAMMETHEASATAAEASGDLTEAAKYLDWATFAADEMNSAKTAGMASAAGAVVLVLGGAVVFMKRN